MYIRNGEFDGDLSWEGILAVGVPGTVDGMITALERYGRMPLDMVIQPAIDLAREGYLLSYSHAQDLNNHRETFKKYQASANYFTTKDSEDFRKVIFLCSKTLLKPLNVLPALGVKDSMPVPQPMPL